MNAEDMEIELLGTRAGEPPASIEARVLEAARRLRSPRRALPPRVLAVAAAAGFFALVAAVVRSEGGGMPARSPQGTPIENWTYTLKKPDAQTGRDAILAILHGDSAVLTMVGGKAVIDARSLTIQVFAQVQGPECSFTARSDSGHFDERSGHVDLEGNIRVERADGFSARATAVSVDLDPRTFRMSIDVLARVRDHLAKYSKEKSRPAALGALPKMEIQATRGSSRDATTTFVAPRIQWKMSLAEGGVPPFCIRYSGAEGRADPEAYVVRGDARADFEDGRGIPALEISWDRALNILQLQVSFR